MRSFSTSDLPQVLTAGAAPPQSFLMAFAQAWRGKGRENAIRPEMLTDPHEARGAYPEPNMAAW
jgi:predicted metalloendopeptidase